MASNSKPLHNHPRRTHRKQRSAALRLSSDSTTAAVLPEYIPAAAWHRQQQSNQHRHFFQGRQGEFSQGSGRLRTGTGLGVDEEDQPPPDYPDSAEEADEDTDTDTNTFYQPHMHLPPLASPIPRPQTASPRRQKRFAPTHKRRQSTQFSPPSTSTESHPYLDALLERSVHALEMSNTLLQSSMSTQTSLANVLSAETPGDATLEASARGLSDRIGGAWNAHATWADDLEEISRGVEGLFEDDDDITVISSPPQGKRVHGRNPEPSVSASLPNSSSPISFNSFRQNGRRPSLDLHQASASTDTDPRLRYSQQNRENLVSPPPRALTQYVPSSQDSNVVLPSTLGLQSHPSDHPRSSVDYEPPSISFNGSVNAAAPINARKPFYNIASSTSTPSLINSTTSLILTNPTLPPQLTDKPHEPATPAYNMLSSFVRSPPPTSMSASSTPSSSFKTSFMRRRGDSSVTITDRNHGLPFRRSSPSPSSGKTPEKPMRGRYAGSASGSSTPSRSGSSTRTQQTRGSSPLTSRISRPMTPPAEESSSSSSDGYVAKLTMQSLRKILDEQPVVPPPKTLLGGPHIKAPSFMPRTPAPVPATSTSTATASVSRLFTKGTHSSSTHAPSPPRQSAMKRSSFTPPAISTSTAASSSTSTPSIPGTPSVVGPTPSPSPTVLSIPDLVERVLKGNSASNSSAPSSGQSTPKRISFAELPESYSSTRPPSARFAGRSSRKARKRDGKGKDKDDDSGGLGVSPSDLGGGWWAGWLMSGGGGGAAAHMAHSSSSTLARHEERIEDRLTRNWGGRIHGGYGGGGVEEWAV
ncbi:hypothetical protein D9619_000551 [Psilocybe cf. subviscida]|uniref:Uncharacterized protein n=1 Tax=Psilocybe cf. subviscida TaxID=2480587 RepID=A0A8H5BF10_9AGAR|nr:hypothetical protein D9619_000551 [Psilocybe cf. subviscida]